MKTILINSKEGYGIDANLIKDGWLVVNAPRPIPGELQWQSTFRHGIFYAAGPTEEFGKVWENLDAWPCKLITNEEILSLIEEYCQQKGKSLATCKVPVEKLAHSLHLPYITD